MVQRLTLAIGTALFLLGCGSATTPEPAPAYLSIVSGNLQEGDAGAVLPESLVVRLTSRDDRPIVGRRIDWRPNGVQVQPAQSVTDSDGKAGTTVRLGTSGGIATVLASTANQEEVTFSLSIRGPEPLVRQLAAVPISGDGGIHDVSVQNGIAYVAAWNSGVQIYDVGHGIGGGFPSAPIRLSTFFPDNGGLSCLCSGVVGAFHSLTDPSRRYLFVGQEGPASIGETASGGIHVLNVADPRAPREVARLVLEIGGVQGFRIDPDEEMLYAAWGNGGVIKMNISGSLEGSLLGRVVGRAEPGFGGQFFIHDVQPAGGTLYATDFQRGLWALDRGSLAILGGGDNIPERYTKVAWAQGSRVYTGGWLSLFDTPGNIVNIWNAGNPGQPILSDSLILPGANSVTSISGTPDNSVMVVSAEGGNAGGLFLYNLNTQKPALLARITVAGGLHSATAASINGRIYVFASRNLAAGQPSALMVYDITGAVQLAGGGIQ